MKDKILIENDLYCIAERLKEIEPHYFILYNRSLERYEVHNSLQKDNTYALTVPYDRLDARTVEYVRKTRRERFKHLIEEMERENEKNKIKKINSIKDKTAEEISETVKYMGNEKIMLEMLKEKEKVENEG